MRSTDTIKSALRTASTIRPPRFAAGGVAPPAADYGRPDDIGMYSHGAVAASRMPIARGTPQQIKGYLTKQGVKPDEFKWSGYDEKLGPRASVTREEAARHFHENRPAIAEEVLGDEPDSREWQTDGPTRFSQYALPGGKNYREHLLALKPKSTASKRFVVKGEGMWTPLIDTETGHEVSGGTYGAMTDEAARRNAEVSGHDAPYMSPHWDHPNVLAHLRLSDRHEDTPRQGFVARNKASGNKSEIFPTEEAANGYVKALPASMRDKVEVRPASGSDRKKILHLEELQSDWAQERRHKGGDNEAEFQRLIARRNAAGDDSPEQDALQRQIDDMAAKKGKGVPEAPYIDSTSKWLDLGLKRTLWEAAKGGHDRLVVTPGDEQAKRYDLSRHLRKVEATKHNDGRYGVAAYDLNGKQIHSQIHTANEVPNIVGKELADRIITETNAAPGKTHSYKDLDLKVGGEGMKAFYDKMLPQALQKLARRHDPAAEVKLHGHASHDPAYKNEPGYRVMAGGANGEPMHDSHFITSHGAERCRQELITQGHPADSLTVEPIQPSTKLHALDITPKMRESILKGHPHFESGGAVKPHEKLSKARGGSVNHAPTEAQKAAGNYAKEHVSFQGLPITIENKMGSVRSGRGADGKPWSCKLPADYGYIKRTVGADGDAVDVYVGPHKDSHLVFVVHQRDHRTHKFDEHKCLLGFRSEHEALKCYCDGFSDGKGPDRCGHVETMSLDGFKKWLHRGRTTKPVARGSIVDHAMQLVTGSR